ncbi:MAG: Ig-like domain-containing protein, partial [Halothiobacillaceae bacterium]
LEASYAGIRALQMTSSHTEVTGNGATSVTMCVRDANDAPMPNTTISVRGLDANVVVNNTGEFDDGNQPIVTGGDGCATFSIVAQLPPGAEDVTLAFSVGQEESEQIEVTVKATGEGEFVTQVESLSACSAEGRTAVVTATLYDKQGAVIPNVPVTASMSGASTITISPSNGQTDEDGRVTVSVTYDTGGELSIEALGGASTSVPLTGCDGTTSGSCTESYTGDQASVTSTFEGCSGAHVFTMNFNGTGNFIVYLKDAASGDNLELLANEVGTVTDRQQSVSLTETMRYYLEVQEGAGDWEINVAPLE